MKRFTIAIPLNNGATVERTAWEPVPGLAVHKNVWDTGWVLSHLESRRRITRYTTIFRTRADAIQFAEFLAPLADWTQDADTLLSSVLESHVRAIEDPTVTPWEPCLEGGCLRRKGHPASAKAGGHELAGKRW